MTEAQICVNSGVRLAGAGHSDGNDPTLNNGCNGDDGIEGDAMWGVLVLVLAIGTVVSLARNNARRRARARGVGQGSRAGVSGSAGDFTPWVDAGPSSDGQSGGGHGHGHHGGSGHHSGGGHPSSDGGHHSWDGGGGHHGGFDGGGGHHG